MLAANQAARNNDLDREDIPKQPVQDTENINNTKSMLSFMGGILPSYFASEWSFAQFRIVDSHAICALKDNKIIAISVEGNYYLADLDPKNGGECKKILQRNLLTEDDA